MNKYVSNGYRVLFSPTSLFAIL